MFANSKETQGQKSLGMNLKGNLSVVKINESVPAAHRE